MWLLSTRAVADRPADTRTLWRKFYGDASQVDEFVGSFGGHIDRERIEKLRAYLRSKATRPKFEMADGPRCVRAYWGKWVIDASVYFYISKRDGTDATEIIDFGIDHEGFGSSMGSLLAHETGSTKQLSPHDSVSA